MKAEQHHDVIWLAPWCDGCNRHSYDCESGRTWCADNVYETCEDCGRQPVKYVIAPKKAAEV